MDGSATFPQFSRFPAEIRCLIWMFCLPRRIAEEDFPYTLLDGKNFRQACWPNSTCLQNARVPLIASVCSEAREVVFQWGHHQMSQDDTSLISIWVQPKIDRALHLNWTRRRSEAVSLSYDSWYLPFEDTPVDMFVHRAQYNYHMRASLVGELFHPFDLEELLGSPSYSPRDARSRIPHIRLSHQLEDKRAVDLGAVIDVRTEPTVYVTLVAIALHIDRTAAEASGLFGLLGDTPVQTVDYDDVPQLRRFYELFDSHPALKQAEPHVETLFNLVLSPAFHAAVHSWQEKVKWLLQATMWKYVMKRRNLEPFKGTEPGSVWTPPVPEGQASMWMPPVPEDNPAMSTGQFEPNKDHFWWQEYAEKRMPKVVPQVMLRLCENQCFTEGRLPPMFGDVSPKDHHPGHDRMKINERGWLVPENELI
ncbi:hypothetical protein GQ53DRAFT_818523 [Thozetella sp. PMI_491]|nr:hypothetical protein GQ53DRAFT_818523 [Thozetella sp. PMI_491]